jgi:two-component system cell cycle sensor histidine kinase/response regulator CckA
MIDRGHEAGGDHVIDEAPGPAPGIREFEELTDEFAALHRCAKILTADDGGLDEMLGALAAVLPPALRSSGRATAAVRYDERLYATPAHEVTAWMLCSDFTTTDGRRGSIEIAYLEPWPPPDDGQGRYLRAATRLIESVADLTRTALDRRRAADEAGRVRERLDLALEAAGMGVWERDLANGTVTWSAHLAALVGRPTELRGRFLDFAGYVHQDDYHEHDDFHNNAQLSDPPRTIEFRLRRPDGSWRPVSATGRVFGDGAGAPRRVLAVVTDISARRALEAGLQQAQKLEVLGQVAAGVAHDFSNLLMVITGSALELESQVQGAERETVRGIQDAADRAAGLVRQLLAFSRRSEFRPGAVELNPLIERMRSLLGRVVGRDIVVQTSLVDTQVRVWADPTQLEQLLLNLVVNARDAMPGGGAVTILTEVRQGSSSPAAPQAVIVVQDTGSGIPPGALDQIFEPFFTTKAPGQGTGLGLAVVRAVARQWHGDVTVDSAPGRGAAFRVCFPLYTPPA